MEDEITRLRKRCEALEAERKRLPLALVGFDHGLRIVEWNPAAEALFGYTEAEALGRSPLGLILPEEIPAELSEELERVKSGRMDVRYLTVNRTKGGDAVVCEWFFTPHFDAAGGCTGHTAMGVDRTDRAKVEVALRETLDRLPLALVQNDAEFRVSDWNPAAEALFGWSREEALGRDAAELLLPGRAIPPPLLALQSRWKAGDRDAHSVNENVTKGGRVILCEWHNTPTFDKKGAFTGLTALASDVTERVAMESALRETSARLKILSRRIVDVQEAERRHLARELHDEIGQVLGAIAINLHAIRGGADAPARSRIDECVAAINTTIGQVRELALELRPVMLDTLGLASTLRWLVNHVIVGAGIVAHLDIVPDGEPPPGELATACFRVAQEALTNVIRHSKASQVWVSMSQEDSRSVTVVVRDDGVGFDCAAALARAGGGESLGLLGIRERVELFGGRLDIDSSPGNGATIRVWFPIVRSLP